MADATSTTVADSITAIDLLKIQIEPQSSVINYTLRQTWASGKVDTRDGVVKTADFAPCLAAFCQATPKKKFLQYLVTAGYETTITPV